MSQETKIASLEHALELASRDAVEECDRARSAEARVQQLEEEKREQEEFYGNRIGILEARDLQLERDVEWLHKAEDRIQQLEEERNQLDAKYRQLSLAALQRQSVLQGCIDQLEKALKFQKDQNKMLMEGRRGL